MREYRRQAVRCETKLFDRRREKYSDLILQVMSVMDRIQVQCQKDSSLACLSFNLLAKIIFYPMSADFGYITMVGFMPFDFCWSKESFSFTMQLIKT